jgi:N-acetylneuraminic acid mutarotase
MKKNLILTAIFLCTVWISYGQWTYTNLSEPKNAMAYGVLGDSLVLAGGFGTSGSLSDVEVYDPVTGQGFVTGSNLSVARGNVTGVVCGGKFFCAGGGVFLQTPLTTVDIFDGQTQQWSVEQLSQGRFMLSAISYNSKVFFVGGFVDYYLNGSDAVDIYDLQTQTWSIASLSEPRGGMAASVLGDLAIFAGGMIDQFTFSDRVDIYNFTTNSWSTAALSAARAFPEIAAVGSKVLIAGGITAMGVPSEVVDIYDISNTSWSTASLFMPRCLIKASTLHNKVYFAGGATFNFSWSNYSNIIDIYNEEDESWSIDVMPVNCLNPAIAAIGNYLVIAGGENENGVMDLVQVFYDPQTSISQLSQENEVIHVHPNPAKDKITIDFPDAETGINAQVSIYGSAGQEMIIESIINPKSEIDVSSLAPGLYFLKIENNQIISFSKFIKN